MREMKNSGIEWIGMVPVDWKNQTLRSIITQRDGGAWGKEPFGEAGIVCLRIADFDYEKGKFRDTTEDGLTKRLYTKDQVHQLQLRKNDILIEKSGGGEKTPVGRTVIFDKAYTALFANFMDRIRVDDTVVNPDFVEYWFRGLYFCKVTPFYINQTTGIQNINLSLFFAKEKIFFPLVPSQVSIVKYLNRKCAEIDALTADIESQIETLEQYKRSIITETVTKGLNPDVEMKGSGIEWVGEIPANWEITKIKFIADIYGRIGFRGYTQQDLVDEDEGAITLSPSNFNEMKMSYQKCSYISWQKYEESPEIMIHNGDILFVKTGSTYGKSVKVTGLPKDATINPQLLVFKNIQINSQFFLYFLQSSIIFNQTELAVVGGTIPTISQEKIGCFYILIPPIFEQNNISTYLDHKCAEIDSIIADKQAQLDTLAEYKKSLIYEYVTGKKEVPTA